MALISSPAPEAISVPPCTPLRHIHTVQVVAPAQPDQVGLLRDRASTLLALWTSDADERDSAALVISELLTNAVVHGRSMMAMTLTVRSDDLHVAVVDHGPPSGSIRFARDDPDECGRGLDIVTALSDDVQTEQRPDGRCVHARMSRGRTWHDY